MISDKKKMYSTSCPTFHDNIFDRYLENNLSDHDRDVFEEHYFNCDVCYEALRVRFELNRSLRQSAGSADILKPRSSETPGLISQLWSLPEAPATFLKSKGWLLAILLMFLVTVLISHYSNFQPQHYLAGLNGSLPTQVNSGKIFRPLPYFEDILTNDLRSYDSLNLIETPLKHSPGMPLSFQWSGPANLKFLELSIFNNNGQPLYSGAVKSGFELPYQLQAGLYYWLLEKDNQTLAAGKFTLLPEAP